MDLSVTRSLFFSSNFAAHPWSSFIKSSSCHQSPQDHQQQSSWGCEGHCPGAQRDSSVRGQRRDWPGRGRAALWRYVQGLPGFQPRRGRWTTAKESQLFSTALMFSFSFFFKYFNSFAYAHTGSVYQVFMFISIYGYVIVLHTLVTLFLFKWWNEWKRMKHEICYWSVFAVLRAQQDLFIHHFPHLCPWSLWMLWSSGSGLLTLTSISFLQRKYRFPLCAPSAAALRAPFNVSIIAHFDVALSICWSLVYVVVMA